MPRCWGIAASRFRISFFSLFSVYCHFLSSLTHIRGNKVSCICTKSERCVRAKTQNLFEIIQFRGDFTRFHWCGRNAAASWNIVDALRNEPKSDRQMLIDQHTHPAQPKWNHIYWRNIRGEHWINVTDTRGALYVDEDVERALPGEEKKSRKRRTNKKKMKLTRCLDACEVAARTCVCVVLGETHKWQRWDLTIYDGSFIFLSFSKATAFTKHIRQYSSADGAMEMGRLRRRIWDEEWARRMVDKKERECVCVHWVALAPHFVKWKFLATRFSFCKCTPFPSIMYIPGTCGMPKRHAWRARRQVCAKTMHANKCMPNIMVRRSSFVARAHDFIVTLALRHIPNPNPLPSLYRIVVFALRPRRTQSRGFLLDLVTYVKPIRLRLLHCRINYYSDSLIFEQKKAWNFLHFGGAGVGRCRNGVKWCECVLYFLYFASIGVRLYTFFLSLSPSLSRNSRMPRTAAAYRRPRLTLCSAYAYFSICTRDIRVGPDKEQLEHTSRLSKHAQHIFSIHAQTQTHASPKKVMGN